MLEYPVFYLYDSWMYNTCSWIRWYSNMTMLSYSWFKWFNVWIGPQIPKWSQEHVQHPGGRGLKSSQDAGPIRGVYLLVVCWIDLKLIFLHDLVWSLFNSKNTLVTWFQFSLHVCLIKMYVSHFVCSCTKDKVLSPWSCFRQLSVMEI